MWFVGANKLYYRALLLNPKDNGARDVEGSFRRAN